MECVHGDRFKGLHHRRTVCFVCELNRVEVEAAKQREHDASIAEQIGKEEPQGEWYCARIAKAIRASTLE